MPNSNSSPESQSLSNAWPNTSRPSRKSGHASRPRSRQPRTAAKKGSGRNSGRPFGAKNRSRRDLILKRFDLTSEQVASQPQITPLLKQCGISPARVVEVLRADVDLDSCSFVRLWDSQTHADRTLLGLEALALAAGLTPRRLWELYNGASLMQSRESIGAMLAEALPKVMAVAIKAAKEVRPILNNVGSVVGYTGGDQKAQEMLFKAARILPSPKGSVINIGLPQGQSDDREDDPESGELEPADGFLLKASRAMQQKSLPAPIIEAEVEEDE